MSIVQTIGSQYSSKSLDTIALRENFKKKLLSFVVTTNHYCRSLNLTSEEIGGFIKANICKILNDLSVSFTIENRTYEGLAILEIHIGLENDRYYCNQINEIVKSFYVLSSDGNKCRCSIGSNLEIMTLQFTL